MREYVRLYEHAPQMNADGVTDYRKLAAFGDTVLAATYSEKKSFLCCTWTQNADGDSMFWEYYSPNYEYVKEYFGLYKPYLIVTLFKILPIGFANKSKNITLETA